MTREIPTRWSKDDKASEHFCGSKTGGKRFREREIQATYRKFQERNPTWSQEEKEIRCFRDKGIRVSRWRFRERIRDAWWYQETIQFGLGQLPNGSTSHMVILILRNPGECLSVLVDFQLYIKWDALNAILVVLHDPLRHTLLILGIFHFRMFFERNQRCTACTNARISRCTRFRMKQSVFFGAYVLGPMTLDSCKCSRMSLERGSMRKTAQRSHSWCSSRRSADLY